MPEAFSGSYIADLMQGATGCGPLQHVSGGTEFRTQTRRFVLREDGILEIHALPPGGETAEQALENQRMGDEIRQGKKLPLLVYMNQAAKPPTREASKVYAKQQDDALAMGFVAGSAFTRIVVRLYLRLHKPNCPTKVFPNTEEAVHWLLAQKGQL